MKLGGINDILNGPGFFSAIGMSDEENELKRRGYTLGSHLGEGSYAKVKAAYSDKNKLRVAIKIINKKKAPKDFREKFLPRELLVIKQVEHPNIVRLFEILEFHNKVYIVMEHAGHGDLLEYIKLRGALSEETSKRMFLQITGAVQYLHNANMAHRDMKCENILLDCSNNVKLSDFGFARHYEPGDISKTFCGSAAYAAPEILQGMPYHIPMHDIWSMGVILYIMVCASMPFDDSNIKRMVKDQMAKKISFSKSKRITPECRDLIQRILEVNVKRRITISGILEHPWIVSASVNTLARSSSALGSYNKVSTSGNAQTVVEPLCEENNVVRLKIDYTKKEKSRSSERGRGEKAVTSCA